MAIKIQDELPVMFRKPFRGVSTIQLFDKDTGVQLEEIVHENTYNDRIQYLNYLDTILHCQAPNTTKAAMKYLGNMDEIAAQSIYLLLSRISICGGTEEAIRNLFATLWLTDNTANEDIHGYPNGTPVGFATASSASSTMGPFPCAGTFNITESYISADRLHLVFDFASDKCIASFDSLWLYPSVRKNSYGSDIASQIIPFFHRSQLSASKDFTVPITVCTYSYGLYYLNDDYCVHLMGDPDADLNTAKVVVVINGRTGETIHFYESSNNLDQIRPFYYNPDTSQLYYLKDSGNNYSWESPVRQAVTNQNLCTIDCTTGAIVDKGTLGTLLGITDAALNYSDSLSVAFMQYLILHLSNGNVKLIAITKGTDITTRALRYYLKAYDFNPTTALFTLSYSYEISAIAFSGISSAQGYYLQDDRLFLPFSIIGSAGVIGNAFAVINAITGVVIDSAMMSQNYNYYLDSLSISYGAYHSGDLGRGVLLIMLKNANWFRTPYVWYKPYGAYLSEAPNYELRSALTAAWSTHNKLPATVVKTDQTTMKVQYDIIWDHIDNVIVPALL